MTEEIKQCYRVLDLEPRASLAEVKGAWRELVKVWHPDRFLNDEKLKAKGAAKLRDINRAYEILEAHLRAQQSSHENKRPQTSGEYRPGPPPKERKDSQQKKPSKAVAIYIGAMIVGSSFIGLDMLRVSRAEKREEERQQTVAIKAKRASEEVERLRLAATLEQQKKDEEAKVQKQKQELIDVSRRLATLEWQAARAAEKAADSAKLLAAAQERERQRKTVDQTQARVASEPSRGADAFDPSILDHQPIPKSVGRPIYPFEMRRARIAGEVVVDFIVDANGDVQNAFAVKMSRREFESAAVEAVSKWKFNPGRIGGRNVNSHMRVPIVFNPSEN